MNLKISRHFRSPGLVDVVSNPDRSGSPDSRDSDKSEQESGQADAVRLETASTGVIARIFPSLVDEVS